MRASIATLALIALGHAAAADGTATSSNKACRLARGVTQAQASAGPCGFDLRRRAFAGSPREQADCLLRHVRTGAHLGPSDLTPYLAGIVGQATQPSIAQVQRFVAAHAIDPLRQLGGGLRPGLPARYFVIHDTSSPNCSERGSCAVWGEFPSDLNAASWSMNTSFGHYLARPRTLKAHVITNRLGDSLSARDLAEHVSHIRFDFCFDAPVKTNLFIGVENIQPRLSAPPRPTGKKFNDLTAPVPGFTEPQYERLALIYIAASARAGRWLIPAYHAVLDPYYGPTSAHDDPQNFDLALFSGKVEALVAAMSASAEV